MYTVWRILDGFGTAFNPAKWAELASASRQKYNISVTVVDMKRECERYRGRVQSCQAKSELHRATISRFAKRCAGSLDTQSTEREFKTLITTYRFSRAEFERTQRVLLKLEKDVQLLENLLAAVDDKSRLKAVQRIYARSVKNIEDVDELTDEKDADGQTIEEMFASIVERQVDESTVDDGDIASEFGEEMTISYWKQKAEIESDGAGLLDAPSPAMFGGGVGGGGDGGAGGVDLQVRAHAGPAGDLGVRNRATAAGRQPAAGISGAAPTDARGQGMAFANSPALRY